MIGNDIIDLSIVRDQKKSENSRFLDKIFSPSEKDLLYRAEDREIQLWLLWSMKETAYKAHQRNFDLPRILNPLSFQAHLSESANSGTVFVKNVKYYIDFEIGTEFIHSRISETDFLQKIFFSPISNTTILSKAAEVLNCDKATLQIIKNKNGVPSIVQKGSPIKIPFSKSHHGKFSAFIIPLINS